MKNMNTLNEATELNYLTVKDKDTCRQIVKKARELIRTKNNGTVPSGFNLKIYGEGTGDLNIPYYCRSKSVYTTGQATLGIIKDLEIADNTLYCLYDRETIEYDRQSKTSRTIIKRERATIDEVVKSTPRTNKTYMIVAAIRDAAQKLNKEAKPSVSQRRDADVSELLRIKPEVADELKNHIIDIQFSVPVEGEDACELDDDTSVTYGDLANEKLTSLYNGFNALPFAREAYEKNFVHERSIWNEDGSAADTAKNIAKCWNLVGEITFDCPVKNLSIDAQSLINAAKANNITKDYGDDETIFSYRLLKSLIIYFDKDVCFFKNKELVAVGAKAEVPPMTDDEIENAANSPFDVEW